MPFTPDELETCLRVLQKVADDPSVMDAHERFKALVAKVHRLGKKGQRRRHREADRRADLAAAEPPSAPAEPRSYRRPRACYVCKAPFSELHPLYHLLCPVCADFNARKRAQRADLRGRVALVVGGRIKIGFEVARRLLEDGARVHLTTRFPADALTRLAALPGWEQWRQRTVVHAVDLRDARAVECLAEGLLADEPHLDLLIHNAAQTVKRPPAFYRPLLEAEAGPPALLEARSGAGGHLLGGDEHFPPGELDAFGQQLDCRPSNSWRQKLGEVSTLELLESLLVGAVAPFHLLSRLLPALRRSPHARRFVVAVSAMEGRFEWARKTAHHPHTNMTKAALNMMVRTAAADLAREGVYLNCVDPGWVSHEVPHPNARRAREEAGFRVPLGLADAAARVYDPIVRGLTEPAEPAHGQYLKDYAPAPW